MTHTYAIPPKPVNSPKLRDHRYEVDIARPNARGTHTVHTTLRYATPVAARTVAEALPVDDEHALVNITYYSARDNWQSHHVARRKYGEWFS